MSNSLAIAAVTVTLRDLLKERLVSQIAGMPDDFKMTHEIEVTTQPLDKARDGDTSRNQVNLFLYNAPLNQGWRNQPLPAQIRSGESGQPPLGLNLHYLLTAYGEENKELISQWLLGQAMETLHDFPLLKRERISAALEASGLHEQMEHIRITPLALSTEEMSKLWTTFQTEYRVSAAYQVTVVLIESKRRTRSPLPVLRRGVEDRGVFVVPGLSPSLSCVFPQSQDVPGMSARLGDDLRIQGTNLTIDGVSARLRHSRRNEAIELPLTASDRPGELQVHLPDKNDDPAALEKWTPGMYMLSLVVKRPGLPAWTTNSVPLPLAPTITLKRTAENAGDFEVEVFAEPRLVEEQAKSTLLLFGDRQVSPKKFFWNKADTTDPTEILFALKGVSEGDYVVRLRVDGVDSIPIGSPEPGKPLAFDENQQVKVT